MDFLINELSFIGQAETIFDAARLMCEILKIIRQTNKLRGKNNSVKRHSKLSNCYLTSDLTLYQWFYEKNNSLTHEERIILLKILTRPPFLDEEEHIKVQLQNCQCFYNNKDVSDSSIAGAAYLKGIMISLQNAEEFSDEYITVNLTTENQENQDIKIHNLTQISQARNICPRYKPSPKHNPKTVWKDATVMDLSDQEAQLALNQSIKFNKQRFSYYNDKFYRFHYDNTYDEQGYPTYHGYPVNSSDIPNEIRAQLID